MNESRLRFGLPGGVFRFCPHFFEGFGRPEKICLTYFEICLTYFFLAPGELEKVPNPNAAKDMPHDIYVYVYVVIPAVHRAALAYVLACDLCCKYAPVAECRHKDSVKQ